MNLEDHVEKALVLSSAHIPPHNGSPDWGPFRVIEGEYEYIVVLCPVGLDEHVPAWLLPILARAADAGASYIIFDQDASFLDGIPDYEW